MSPLQFDTITIPAASGSGASLTPSCKRSNLGGSFFFCKAASAQFKMQFDSGTIFPCEAGFYSNGAVTSWDSITFYNYNTYPITLVFYCGAGGIGYSGILFSRNPPTFNRGNLGLSASGVYNGDGLPPQNVTIDSVYGSIKFQTNAAILYIAGVLNGNVRKQIYLTVPGAYGLNGLIVTDAAGNGFMQVPFGSTVILDNSSTIGIYGGIYAAWCLVGEVYYS